jgi:outer membrane receptor protein involved in Fe transport
LEYGEQVIRNRNQTQFKKLDVNTIEGLEYMPSLAFKYTLKENHVFRLVGSKTVTRPKFSEVAPFQYVADFAGITAQGNRELDNGTNYNGDVRYEWYPSKTDIISVGGFYKYLQSPIEKTMIATASGQLQSFANAKSATVAGVEIEVSKNLGFFSKD